MLVELYLLGLAVVEVVKGQKWATLKNHNSPLDCPMETKPSAIASWRVVDYNKQNCRSNSKLFVNPVLFTSLCALSWGLPCDFGDYTYSRMRMARKELGCYLM